MSAVASRTAYTIDEFLALPDHDLYELVDGKLAEVHVSNLSSAVAGRILTRLTIHCEPKKLGEVFPCDSYYQCFADRPRHARKPDVSFIRKERLPQGWKADGYFTIAPDLAVEVLSPNDLAYKVDEKISEYLEAGVKLIWIINPEQRLVTVHRADGSSVVKRKETDTLDGEQVIAGFSCKVGELFPSDSA
jgi:Uma2 family endonuclease